MTATIKTCQNCNHQNSGIFCSNCSQKFDVKSFTLMGIFNEVVHAFTHADKNIFTFAKKITYKCGTMANEYITEYKRKKYFNPFTYFLLITALAGIVELSKLNMLEKIYNYNNQYAFYLTKYIKYFSILTLLCIAVFTSLFNIIKPKFKFAEYFVFSVFILSAINTLEVLFTILEIIVIKLFKLDIAITNNLFFAVLQAILFGIFSYQFHKGLKKISNYKHIMFGLLIPILKLLLTMLIIFAIINGFEGLGNFSYFGIKFTTR